MKSERVVGIRRPRGRIEEKMQIFSLCLELLERNIDGRIRLPKLPTPPPTRHVVKGFCVNIKAGRETTRRLQPSGGSCPMRRSARKQNVQNRRMTLLNNVRRKKKSHLHASVLPFVPRVAGTGVGGSDQILQLLNFEKAIYKTKSKELLKGQCRLS